METLPLLRKEDKGGGMMKRLTDSDTRLGFVDSDILPSYEALYERLREYEDAEEQGLLLRLLCKVGDSIYSVVEDGLTIIKLKFSLDFYVRRKNDFGKTVFLTQAEAEAKLKEMEETK